MEKAPQLGRKGLEMVEAKVKAEHRARVSVSARAVRKAPASKAERAARFRPVECVTNG